MSSLEQLLARLAEGGTRSLTELAAELSVSTELLEQMLFDLKRAGYIREAAGPCDETCQGCPRSGGRALLFGGRVWTLTEEGQRAASAP